MEENLQLGHLRLFQSDVKAVRNMCDIVVYNKKYIFGLCPVTGAELLKSLELFFF